jgi:hypothetical protein
MAETALAKPEQGDRSLAAAVHAGAIFFPLLVPLVAYFVTRTSRPFVAAHARQSLVETIVLNVLIGTAMVVSLGFTIWRLWGYYQNDWQDIDWWGFALRFALWWVAMGVLWVINLVVSIRQALQALRGEWPRSARKRAAKGKGVA